MPSVYIYIYILQTNKIISIIYNSISVFIVTGNEDAEESEESHDADEEEEMPTTTESPRNEMESESPEDGTDTADLEVEATMWPYVPQEQ